MAREDSLYLVLDTSEVSSAFTMKTKGSHPFFSMGSTLKVLLLERLVRKKNYFDLRVQQKKASRGSLPQQLAELLSWSAQLNFASDQSQVSQRPALNPWWSATEVLSCSVWEMSSLTELNWPSQLGKVRPNIFSFLPTNYNIPALSQIPAPLWSRQPWGLQKEHMWINTKQGRLPEL